MLLSSLEEVILSKAKKSEELAEANNNNNRLHGNTIKKNCFSCRFVDEVYFDGFAITAAYTLNSHAAKHSNIQGCGMSKDNLIVEIQ